MRVLLCSLVLGFQDSKRWVQKWKGWDESKFNGILNGTDVSLNVMIAIWGSRH